MPAQPSLRFFAPVKSEAPRGSLLLRSKASSCEGREPRGNLLCPAAAGLRRSSLCGTLRLVRRPVRRSIGEDENYLSEGGSQGRYLVLHSRSRLREVRYGGRRKVGDGGSSLWHLSCIALVLRSKGYFAE